MKVIFEATDGDAKVSIGVPSNRGDQSNLVIISNGDDVMLDIRLIEILRNKLTEHIEAQTSKPPGPPNYPKPPTRMDLHMKTTIDSFVNLVHRDYGARVANQLASRLPSGGEMGFQAAMDALDGVLSETAGGAKPSFGLATDSPPLGGSVNEIRAAEDWQRLYRRTYEDTFPSVLFIRAVQADAIRVAGNTAAHPGVTKRKAAMVILKSAASLEKHLPPHLR